MTTVYAEVERGQRRHDFLPTLLIKLEKWNWSLCGKRQI